MNVAASGLRVVCEGESAHPGLNTYWIGRAGDTAPIGQVIASPETMTELLAAHGSKRQ